MDYLLLADNSNPVSDYDKYANLVSGSEFQTPHYTHVNNAYEINKDSNDCNPFQADNYFGNYFRECQNPSVMWGSERPVKEVCPTEYKDHSGQPCHSIWNNLTRRKSIVQR